MEILMALIVIGIAWIIIFGWCAVHYQKKTKVTRDSFNKIFDTHCYKAMCDKKDTYLDMFKGTDNYDDLKELYKYLPNLYNEYISAVIRQPLRMKEPTNPYTAAAVGTVVGGTAVGMVAAHNAIEKKKVYYQNSKDVKKSEQKVRLAHFSVKDCFTSIEYLINENELTREDWKEEKRIIQEKLEKKYKIS